MRKHGLSEFDMLYNPNEPSPDAIARDPSCLSCLLLPTIKSFSSHTLGAAWNVMAEWSNCLAFALEYGPIEH